MYSEFWLITLNQSNKEGDVVRAIGSDYVTFFVALSGCGAIPLRAEGTWKTTVYPAHTANGAVPDPTSFWCGSGLPG